MFDGLKDKLGNFRSDVEETAEEKAEEEADADADAAEAESAEGEPTDTEQPRETDAESATEPAASPAETDGEASAAVATGDEAEAANVDEAAGVDETSDVDESTDAGEAAAEPTADEETTDEETSDETDAAEADEEAAGSNTGFGKKLKSAARGRVVIEEEDLEEPLWELEMALLSADVEMSVAEAILDRVEENLVGETKTFTKSTGGVVESALRDALVDVMGVGQFDFEERVAEAEKPVVIVFTGVNGVGKTTTIAKLARYFEERGLSSVLANGDTYRAGANEQIAEHAAALDKRLISHQQGGDPAAVLYDAVEYAEANDVDVVLGDTAGRLHTDEGLMDQLEKIHRVVDPDLTLFVDEAVAGQDAVERAREFDAAAEIDGAILTKADADPQGGAAISIAHVTGEPVLFLGTGQGYDDLVRFDPEEMVDRLLDEE